MFFSRQVVFGFAFEFPSQCKAEAQNVCGGGEGFQDSER